MLPWGDHNLQLYFRVVFICICTAFTTRTPFLFPQTPCIVAYVAAFLISIIKLFFLWDLASKSRQRDAPAFQVFTPLSQLIFSLAGILMRGGLSCNTCAWQEFLRWRPAVAWLRRSTLVKWKRSDVSVAITLFAFNCNAALFTAHTHTQKNTFRKISAS